MPSLLITGYTSYDSGKTILAGSLVSILRSMGLDAVGVKPLAGVDAWEYPWILREIRDRRLVVSGDALRLYTASEGVEALETISPVTVIMTPRDPSKQMWRLPDPEKREPVLGRISVCRANRVDTVHFINTDALNRSSNGIAAAVLEAAGRLQPLPLRAGDDFAERVLSGGFTGEAESCIARVLARHEYVVFESNSDVAVPTPSALGADWVLVVAPGSIGVVKGERWAKAVELLAGSGGLKAITVREVLALTGVLETFQLPFLYDPMEGYRERDLDALISYITGHQG